MAYRRVAASIAAIAVGATTVVWAQNLDAIKQRREVMKAIAIAGTSSFKMLKGEAPVELDKVAANLRTFQNEAAKLKNLFPDDSKTGGDTDASPKIWQARAEFETAIDTFISTAKTAEAAIKDEASFKEEYPKVARSCGACHKETDGFTLKLSESFKKLKQ
jgi:cytochrome c556